MFSIIIIICYGAGEVIFMPFIYCLEFIRREHIFDIIW